MKSERAAVPLAPLATRERLLVVDDDPDVRDSLERALRHAGYAVTTAVHGADALDSVARSPVDLSTFSVRTGDRPRPVFTAASVARRR
jgi:CheY-like chemotaxis protein